MAKSDLQEVLKEIKSLREDLTGGLRKKAERLETIVKLLEPIKFRVKQVATAYDEYGNPYVKIIYESDVQTIRFPANEEPIFDKFITSANMLNMIPYGDMERIKKAIESAEGKKRY